MKKLEKLKRSIQKIDSFWQENSDLVEDVMLHDPRLAFEAAFEVFMRFNLKDWSLKDWCFKDDEALYNVMKAAIEIFTGEDGEQVIRDFIIQAKALKRYQRLAKHLERK